MLRLKKICYRGGIAGFDIPASWKEEYEPARGATCYEDTPDSGTLRLNVLTFSSNGKETGAEMVSSLVAKNGYKSLRKCLAIKQSMESTEEQGEQLLLFCWEVAVPVEPCSVRLDIFSYTILASQQHEPQVQNEIELLNTSIRAGEFSSKRGASGDYEHT